MHHGTCVTHVPWCIPGLLTRGGGKTFPTFPAHVQPAILRIWQEAHWGDLGSIWWFTLLYGICNVGDSCNFKWLNTAVFGMLLHYEMAVECIIRVFAEITSACNSLRWRHNGRDSVSNHQPHHCLLNRLFRRRSKKTSKLRVTDLCMGNSPETGEFPAQRASNAENVSIWWRHHESLN